MTTMVMSYNRKTLPSQERIIGVADTSNFEEIYGPEFDFFYATCRYASNQQALTLGKVRPKFLKDQESTRFRGS